MAYKKKNITLDEGQKQFLKNYISKGVKPVQAVKRARILLEADDSSGSRPPKESVIADKVGVSLPTIKAVKKAFHDQGKNVEAVVLRKKREMGPKKIKVT